MKRKRFSEEKIIGLLQEYEAGAKVDEFCPALRDRSCLGSGGNLKAA